MSYPPPDRTPSDPPVPAWPVLPDGGEFEWEMEEAPADTNLGWRLAAFILIADVLTRVALYGIPLLSDAGPARGRGPTQGPGGIVLVFAAIGVLLVLTVAQGLLKGEAWAKWLTLALVLLGGVFLICVALVIKPAQLPGGSRGWVVGAGIWRMVGWYVLLDRPASGMKVAVGFGMTVAWYVGSVGFAVASAN